MHSYVFVVNSCYGEETGNGVHAYCDKGTIRSGLPAGFGYEDEIDTDEIDLDELGNDIFGDFASCITRSIRGICLQISVKEVREYLLNRIFGASIRLRTLKLDIQAGADDPLVFSWAASALCDPFDLRIQDGDVQYDIPSWFYKKLVEANQNAEDSIVFEIVQAFSYNYAKGEENA